MTHTPKPPNAYRAFIALPLPPAVREHLAAVQHCLADQGVRARWVRPESMHLTLKFIGRLEAERVAAIAGLLDAVAPGCPPLRLTVQGLGGFPNPRRARVLWMGVGGEGERLEELRQVVDAGLSRLGWPPETRAFKGHLTLARAKGRRTFDADVTAGLAACEPEAPVAFTTDRLTLYRSTLGPRGAVYDILHQAVFTAG